jgi:hypothetical protein
MQDKLLVTRDLPDLLWFVSDIVMSSEVAESIIFDRREVVVRGRLLDRFLGRCTLDFTKRTMGG